MEVFSIRNCPTAMACGSSGDLVFCAFSNDELHMVDVREHDNKKPNNLFKSGGHSGMIKSIWVSEDESLMYTGGSDGTVRLWDIGARSVIHTYGVDKYRSKDEDDIDDLVDEVSHFHIDSVTMLKPSTLGGK